MQKSFEIRHPSACEYESLKALWLKCFDDSPVVVKRFFNNAVTPENVIGAFCGGEAVSVLYMIESLITNKGKDYSALYIYAVCTDPDFRGKGLMKGCFELIFQKAKERGVDYLFLVPAQENLFSMYRKLGFENGFSYSESMVYSKDYSGEAPVCESLSFEAYKNIRKELSKNITLATLLEKGFGGFISPESETVKTIKIKNSYAVYENEKNTIIVHELFGDDSDILKTIFNLTKADSLIVRGVAHEGNKKSFGMYLAISDAPPIENAFFGIPYGG